MRNPYRVRQFGALWQVLTKSGRAARIVESFATESAAVAKADELNRIYAQGMRA